MREALGYLQAVTVASQMHAIKETADQVVDLDRTPDILIRMGLSLSALATAASGYTEIGAGLGIPMDLKSPIRVGYCLPFAANTTATDRPPKPETVAGSTATIVPSAN